MTNTTTIGAVKVTTFPSPPPDFIPLEASAEQLDRYGLPPCPDPLIEPYAAFTWVETFRRYPAYTYIEPTFEAAPKRHDPRQPVSDRVEPPTSQYWCGSVLRAQGETTFRQISGTWTVPKTYTRPPFDPTPYQSLHCLGLGGYLSPEVLQVGTQTDSLGNCSAFLEWVPGGRLELANFPVTAGDVLSGSVEAVTTSSGRVFLWDITQLVMTYAKLDAPGETFLAGDTAEAIVERGGSVARGGYYELGRFGEVYFDNVVAFTSLAPNIPPGFPDPRRHYFISAGTLLTMVADDGVTPIAVPSFRGNSDMLVCSYTGP